MREVGMQFFKYIQRITRSIDFPKISPTRYQLIKADALLQYGHYDEALIEAQKARNDKNATALEIEYAKGKIVQVMNEKNKHEDTSTMNFKPR